MTALYKTYDLSHFSATGLAVEAEVHLDDAVRSFVGDDFDKSLESVRYARRCALFALRKFHRRSDRWTPQNIAGVRATLLRIRAFLCRLSFGLLPVQYRVETVSARWGKVPGASWPAFHCLRGYDAEGRRVFERRIGVDARRQGPRSRYAFVLSLLQDEAERLNSLNVPRHRATFYDDAGNEAGGIVNATEEDLEDAIWAEYDRACDDR